MVTSKWVGFGGHEEFWNQIIEHWMRKYGLKSQCYTYYKYFMCFMVVVNH